MEITLDDVPAEVVTPEVTPEAAPEEPREETLEEVRARLAETYPYLNDVDYKTLTSIDQVNEWLSNVPKKSVLVLDWETNSLSHLTGDLVGVALSYQEREAVYVPIAHKLRPELNVPWHELRPALTEAYIERELGCFNYGFEKNWAEANNFHFTKYVDVQVGLYNHDINIRGGLKKKTRHFLGIQPIDFSDVVSKEDLKAGKTFEDICPYLATLYAAGDADFTMRHWNLVQPSLKEQSLVWAMDNRLVEVIRVMENNHVMVDRDKLLSFRQQLIDQVERIKRRIFRMVGKEFDISSPQQVGHILYSVLGLKPTKVTDGGKPSTDVETLTNLESEHPVAWEIGKYRRTLKSLSTFVDNFVRGLSPEGSARFSMMTARATTGRIAAGGSESTEAAPTYAETGYTEVNCQAITATGKIKKNKAKWLIHSFDEGFLSECEATYLQERLQRHYIEWVDLEKKNKTTEEWSAKAYGAWKKTFTAEELEAWIDRHGFRAETEAMKSKKMPISCWRKFMADEWTASAAKEEWRDLFYEPHKNKVLTEYRASQGKSGCVFADPVGWGSDRSEKYICPKDTCECIEKSRAVGEELTEELAKTVDLKELPAIRTTLVARPGYKHVAIDYSGVEVRVAGNISQEPVWIKEFTESPNPDPHSATARSIYEIPDGTAVLKEQRDISKTVNFTVLFGGGGYTVAANIGDGMAPEEGDRIVAKFFASLSKLNAFIKQTHKEAKTLGCVKTRFGRKRSFTMPENNGDRSYFRKVKKIERDSFSTKVQGSAADIMRFSLVKLHAIILKRKWEDICRMLLTVHDEILFEIREDMLEVVIPVLVEAMTKHNIPDWKIPLDCDVEIGDSWGDSVEYKLRDGQLILSSDWKRMLKERESEVEVEVEGDVQDEEEPETSVCFLMNFDLTKDNLTKFRTLVHNSPGDVEVKLMFSGIPEELKLEETVDLAALEKILEDEGLSVLKR